MSWITAEDALSRLGVRRQTLYAYVSRGRIEARTDPADSRRSLYSLDDVQRLVVRRSGPRSASDVAREAIAWGEPLLSSSLTTVLKGRLYYRGVDAIELSETSTLEAAAALFWKAPFAADPQSVAPSPSGSGRDRMFNMLARRASADASARGRPVRSLAVEAGSILSDLANQAAGASSSAPIHERLATAWSLSGTDADTVRRALVLLMDHELNPSTFAARVAASTGASLAACALAGLSTLTGPLHGGAVVPTIAFLKEAGRVGAQAAVRARLDEGRSLPGVGHPLYPAGDPRAASLLARLDIPDSIRELERIVVDSVGEHPNVDFAIAAFALTAPLSPDAAFLVFAIGRSVGWMGHAMEQIETGQPIRPRARYVGRAPPSVVPATEARGIDRNE
ncbi:citrate synthase [bacterium]|nr:citrate synthase [bacterium]